MIAIAILAGDKKRKALLKINQKSLGEIVLDTVKDIDAYRILVAKKEVLNFYSNYANYFDFTVASSFFKNHVKAINKAKAKGINEIIFVHCDLPLLNKESLKNFIDISLKEDAHFVIPVCNAKTIEKKFPNYRIWKWKSKDLDFVVGNVYYIRFKGIESEKKFKGNGLINTLYKYRNKKKPLNLLFIGLAFLLKENFGLIKHLKDMWNMAKRKYNLEEISKSISPILFGDETSYKLIRFDDPSIFIDIDNEEDYNVLRAYFEG